MPGIQWDSAVGLIRPTTRTKVAEWAGSLSDVSAQQVWDWLRDAGLNPSSYTEGVFMGGYDYGPEYRAHYLRSALTEVDTANPGQVRKFMEVLEECLMATQLPNARSQLTSALSLDGYIVDEGGYIVAPASVELFEVDLSAIDDPSAITQQIGRIHRGLHTNPEEAIDATAALVAASMKLLLASYSIPTGKNPDLTELAAKARPIIEGHYRDIGLNGDGVQKISGGLVSIVNGIAPIRNDESPTHPGLTAKNSHVAAAELLVSAASAVVRAALGSIKRP